MRVRCITDAYPVSLINGKIYDVIAEENGWYRIIDEDGVDKGAEYPGYLYPKGFFEVVEE